MRGLVSRAPAPDLMHAVAVTDLSVKPLRTVAGICSSVFWGSEKVLGHPALRLS